MRITTLSVCLLWLAGLGCTASAQTPASIVLNMSYSGNTWQIEAANGIKALASTEPYDLAVNFRTVISGADVRRQIADLQAIIASKPSGIILYPLSPTALNKVIRQACAQGVLVFAYDSTVTEPCAYNVSNITARYGANSAQWLVNSLGGKGEIIVNHGVAGTTVTKTYGAQALNVFRRYPGIKIVGQFFGNWNDVTSREEVAKLIVEHPNIAGIWTIDGTLGSLEAVIDNRPSRLVSIVGQSNNSYRLMLADAALRQHGLKGVSSSAAPSVGAYAFKLMMEVLTGKRRLTQHNIEYPLPWVEDKDLKMCPDERLVDGCNVFAEGKVSPLFMVTALDEKFVPELDVGTIRTGKPRAGATVQRLPEVKYAENIPGVNCDVCPRPSRNAMDPTFVTPMRAP